MSAMLAAALEYARDGLRVVALHEPTDGRCSCPRGAGCRSPGKHPRIEWKGAAAPDEGTVRGWWAHWPNANVGYLTGAGLAVLDVDPRNGGDESLAKLVAEHGELPETAEVATGGGGRHLYFKVAPGVRSRDLAAGLELKAEGALVVAPPSIHASGREYTWVDREPVADAPGWLLADASERRNGATPMPERIAEGERDNRLTSVAGSMRRRGAEEPEIVEALRAINTSRCDPPLPDRDVTRIAASVARYEPGAEAKARAEAKAAVQAARAGGEFDYGAASAIAKLPADEQATVKRQLKEALGGKLNLNDLSKAIARARRERAVVDDGLPRIITTDRPLRDQSDEALAALHAANDPPVLFSRASSLARVLPDERGRHLVNRVRVDELRDRLARIANTVAVGQHGDRHVSPPDDLVRNLLARSDAAFPPLDGVVEAPVLRADGTVLDRPGYDRETRLVYAAPAGFELPPVPDEPTSDELRAATALVDEAVCDFPFDGAASRANALALLMTLVMRPAIDGRVPLAVIDSTKAGSGKGLLADVASVIAVGRAAAMMGAPTREEEWEKTLLAVALDGPPLVVIDNVDAVLRSAALAKTITAGRVAGRVLGRSETVEVAQGATWIATGNNVRFGGDLARRCYRCRLDALTARPWLRAGPGNGRAWRHDPLLPWITARRADLLAALLTIGRAWFAAGKPAGEAQALGGFEAWSEVIGGVLANAGVHGFLDPVERDRLYAEADEEAGEWEAFLGEWADLFGDEAVSTMQLAETMHGDAGYGLRAALPGDLADALEARGLTRRLGKALSRHERTRYGERELHVERASVESRGGRVLWRVIEGAQVTQVPQVPLRDPVGEPTHLRVGGLEGQGRVGEPGEPANLQLGDAGQ